MPSDFVPDRFSVMEAPIAEDAPRVIFCPLVKLPEAPSEVVYFALLTLLTESVTVMESVKAVPAGDAETLPKEGTLPAL